MPSAYLNTDVDIASADDQCRLAEVLDEKCELLYGKQEDDGLWHICIEAAESGIIGSEEHSPARDIGELLDVLEGLDGNLKRLLARSSTFDFNIGWQSSEDRPEGVFTIPSDLLRRISGLGATLTVTVYPSSEDDFCGKAI